MIATMDPPDSGGNGRLEAASASRNQQPIGDVLAGVIGERACTIIEIASGTGQHAAGFVERFATVIWHPSDISDTALASIRAWRETSDKDRFRAPVRLDVTGQAWRRGATIAGLPDACDGVIAVNMAQVAPWAATQGLFEGAGKRVRPGGFALMYGPYSKGGVHTAPSNAEFDAALKARNRDWGVRDVDDIAAVAAESGFDLADTIAMPANNTMLIFRRSRRG